jgi:hypothetical protein
LGLINILAGWRPIERTAAWRLSWLQFLVTCAIAICWIYMALATAMGTPGQPGDRAQNEVVRDTLGTITKVLSFPIGWGGVLLFHQDERPGAGPLILAVVLLWLNGFLWGYGCVFIYRGVRWLFARPGPADKSGSVPIRRCLPDAARSRLVAG